jgi:flagellar basal body rod protein FlgC
LLEEDKAAMAYEYELQNPSDDETGVGGVADVYVVRDLSQRVEPSPEFLAALQNLSASTQAVVRSLIADGFEKAVRKG